MARFLWSFAHNCIAHPLLFLTRDAAWVIDFHDKSAGLAWPDDPEYLDELHGERRHEDRGDAQQGADAVRPVLLPPPRVGAQEGAPPGSTPGRPGDDPSGAARPSLRLLVGAGAYDADTLPGLLWGVLKHRTWHFCRGEGWVD